MYSMLLCYNIEDFRRRCKGGGPLFVDFLLQASDGEVDHDLPFAIDSKLRRRAVEEYLSLIGDYGEVVVDRTSTTKKWQILKSTHPWREGGSLFQAGDIVWSPNKDKDNGRQLSWRSMGMWQVFESSLDIRELEFLFDIPSALSRYHSSRILSRL